MILNNNLNLQRFIKTFFREKPVFTKVNTWDFVNYLLIKFL